MAASPPKSQGPHVMGQPSTKHQIATTKQPPKQKVAGPSKAVPQLGVEQQQER